ncbi:MAG TPA: MFS transporter [Steroidobacteraceae bacterium]|nr:MFS transporter [Steroidobacteraceae bacterium]
MRIGADAGARTAMPSARYQVLLTALLSLNFGFVLFDRNALNFLMPFIQPELGINNTQVGLLAGGLSFTWAVAALGIGLLSDRMGSRKGLLIAATVMFSLCSFMTGIAASFLMLLAARLLMGVAEGGVMPLSQALIATDVTPRHRGLAMGVAQGLGSSLLGSFVAPVALVAFTAAFGWRHAFFLAGAPGLLTALLIAWWVRASPTGYVQQTVPSPQHRPLREVLRERNVILCALIGILLVSYLVVCWAFMPLYLINVRGFPPATEGWLMGSLGISATLASFAISALSDRVGRRPVMIIMPLLATSVPLGAMFFTGNAWGLATIFFIGWSVTGVYPLFMSTIPAESVPQHRLATALGICMGVGEILGGALSPFLAGFAADRVGLQAPLWLLFGVALLSGLLSLGLRETAPRLR